MSDNRKVAADLLLEAGNVVTKDRPGVHGSAENSFQMIAEMWSTYINHQLSVRRPDLTVRHLVQLTPVDVANMMVDLKKARATYGDVTNRDNFVDGIGYLALAGMLALPDPDESNYAAGLAKTLDATKPPKVVKAKDTHPDLLLNTERELAEMLQREQGVK